MKLMIDTNVILDVLLDRKPFSEDSSIVWKICESYEAEGMISSLSFANMIYVLRKHVDPKRVMHLITELSLIFRFQPLDQGILYIAAACQWDDYEDAIQYATAVMNKADYIVTRDKEGFKGSDVPVITPHEMVEVIKKTLS